MEWQTKGFASEDEYRAYLSRARKLYIEDGISRTQYDDLTRSGTKASFDAVLVTPPAAQAPVSTPTVAVQQPKNQAVPPQPRYDSKSAMQSWTATMADQLEAKAKQEAYRTSGLSPETASAIQKQASEDAKKGMESLVTTPRESPTGERVSPVWEWLMTPTDWEPALLTSMRPQQVMTADEKVAYDEAVQQGDVGYLPRFLTWVATSPGKSGRTTESTLGWLMRLANIPSAAVAAGLDAAAGTVLDSTPVSLADRISRGEGLADLSRETMSAAQFEERYPTKEAVIARKGTDAWTYPEMAAFVVGGIGDLLIPFDLGLAELGKGARYGAKLAREIPSLSKPAIIGESAARSFGDAWLSQIPTYEPKLASGMRTKVVDTVIQQHEPKIQEWKEWAISKESRENTPAPEGSADLGLPVDPVKAFDLLSSALTTPVPKNVPINTYIGRLALASKVIDESRGTARIGNVLVPVDALGELQDQIRNIPSVSGNLQDILSKAEKVDSSTINIDAHALGQVLESVGTKLDARIDVNLARKLEPILEESRKATTKRYTHPDGTPVARPTNLPKLEAARANMAITDWNRLVEVIGETIALDTIPGAIDLTKPSAKAVPKAQELGPQHLRNLIARITSDNVVEDLEAAAPVIRQLIEEGKYRVGAASERIKSKIGRKKLAAFAQAWQDAPEEMLLATLRNSYGGRYIDQLRSQVYTPATPLYRIARFMENLAQNHPQQIPDIISRILEDATDLGRWIGKETPQGISPDVWARMASLTIKEEAKASPMMVQIAAMLQHEQKLIYREVVSDILSTVRKKDKTLYQDLRRYLERVSEIVDAGITEVLASKGVAKVDVPGPPWVLEALHKPADMAPTIPDKTVAGGITPTVTGGEKTIERTVTVAPTPKEVETPKSVTDIDKEKAYEQARRIFYRDLTVNFFMGESPNDAIVNYLHNYARIEKVYDPVGLSMGDVWAKEVASAVAAAPETATLVSRAKQYIEDMVGEIHPDQVKDAAKMQVREILSEISGLTPSNEATNLASSLQVDPRVAEYYRNGLEDLLPSANDLSKVLSDFRIDRTNTPTMYVLEKLMQADPDTVDKVLTAMPAAWLGAFADTSRTTLFSRIVSWGRSGMLGGLVLPNLPYHVANVLTAPALITVTTGWRNGTLAAADAIKGIGSYVGSIVPSYVLGRIGMQPKTPDIQLFTLPSGKAYTRDMIAKIALDHGLLGGQQSAELVSNVARDILAVTMRDRKGAEIGTLRAGLRKWFGGDGEGYIASVAASVDSSWRVNMLTRALLEGKSEQEAIDLARASIFDYSSLTKVERKYIASWFWFYRFFRENLVSTVDRMISNPNDIRKLMTLQSLPSKLADRRNVSEEQQSIFSGMYDNRIALGLMKDVAANGYHSDIAIYGPPMPLNDVILSLQGIFGFFGDVGRMVTVGDPAMTGGQEFAKVAETVAGTAASKAGPFYATLAHMLGKQLSFGELGNLPKSVDPRLVIFTKSLGLWDAAKGYFDIREARPGDRDYPKNRIVDQFGDSYYYIPDKKNRATWAMLTADALTLIGIGRNVRDYSAMANVVAGVGEDDRGEVTSSKVAPQAALRIGESPSSIITWLKLLGGIATETSQQTLEDYMTVESVPTPIGFESGEPNVEAGAYRAAEQELRDITE